MKKLYLILGSLLLVSILILVGCSKPITQQEAQQIAKDYVLTEFGAPEDGDLTISQSILKDDGWHVQLIVGDDKGTVIINKRGDVIKFEAYEWI